MNCCVIKLIFLFYTMGNRYRVLRRTDGLDDMGSVQTHLIVCLFLAWTLSVAAIIKGVRTLGKVCDSFYIFKVLFVFLLCRNYISNCFFFLCLFIVAILLCSRLVYFDFVILWEKLLFCLKSCHSCDVDHAWKQSTSYV